MLVLLPPVGYVTAIHGDFDYRFNHWYVCMCPASWRASMSLPFFICIAMVSGVCLSSLLISRRRWCWLPLLFCLDELGRFLPGRFRHMSYTTHLYRYGSWSTAWGNYRSELSTLVFGSSASATIPFVICACWWLWLCLISFLAASLVLFCFLGLLVVPAYWFRKIFYVM